MTEREEELQRQLDDLTSKFNDWRVRAKAGVDKQRSQILELSQQNDALAQENDALQSVVERLKVSVCELEERHMEYQRECANRNAEHDKQVKLLEAELAQMRSDASSSSKVDEGENQISTSVVSDQIAMIKKENSAQLAQLTLLMQRYAHYLEDVIFASEVAVLYEKSTLLFNATKVIGDAAISGYRGKAALAEENLEKHRKKAELALKLVNQSQDGTRSDFQRLQNTVKAKDDENTELKNAVHQRDLAIAALEEQLEHTSQQLFEQHNEREQDHQALRRVTELETQLRACEMEFAEKEEELQERHRAALNEAVSQHDEDIKAFRAHYENELEKRSHSKLSPSSAGISCAGDRDPASGALSAEDNDDQAYTALLRENTSLRSSMDTLTAEQQQSRKEIAVLQEKLSRYAPPKNNSSSVPGTSQQQGSKVHMDTSGLDISQLRGRVSELETQISSLSETLWRTKEELLEQRSTTMSSSSRRQESSAKPTQGVDAQHAAYARAVLVKMLCAKTSDVYSNLMPVVSTVFSLTSEDLKAVYAANPSWLR